MMIPHCKNRTKLSLSDDRKCAIKFECFFIINIPIIFLCNQKQVSLLLLLVLLFLSVWVFVCFVFGPLHEAPESNQFVVPLVTQAQKIIINCSQWWRCQKKGPQQLVPPQQQSERNPHPLPQPQPQPPPPTPQTPSFIHSFMRSMPGPRGERKAGTSARNMQKSSDGFACPLFFGI